MLRDLVAVLVGINSVGAIVGYTIRRMRGKRALSHIEYQERLERENEELDMKLKKIGVK